MSNLGSIGGGAASGAATGSALGPWGALAGGLLGGALGFVTGQKKAALEQAALDEKLRRMKLEQDQVLGRTTAAGAASGVEFDSTSLQGYLASMGAEFRAERSYASMMAKEGIDAASQANGFQLAGDIGSSLFRFGSANNWWRTPAVK